MLFEVAPLDSYRVMLKVDERDISQLRVGQTGGLALAGLPGELLPVQVEKITPVATTEEGRNLFRVEAALRGSSSALRPGMEGVAKIDVERAQPVLDLDPQARRLDAALVVVLVAVSPRSAGP